MFFQILNTPVSLFLFVINLVEEEVCTKWEILWRFI